MKRKIIATGLAMLGASLVFAVCGNAQEAVVTADYEAKAMPALETLEQDVSISALVASYGLDLNAGETARGCQIVQQGPGNACVFDCGGDWCFADCDDPTPCNQWPPLD